MEGQYQRLGDSSTAMIQQTLNKQLKLDDYIVCYDVVLGRGSFSSVYLCRNKDNSKAAVKVLKKKTKKSEQIIKVSKAQVKIIRKLNHPNIVKYIGSYQSQNNYYILFQYIEGKTLRQILDTYKRMQIRDVLYVASGVINAICYLFEKKIMHRDIKPDNIKFFKGKSTLIDFGFACELPQGQKTIISQSVGTPSYMSPQLLQRKKYNYKSDLWSLGMVLYEIIYGRLPWKGRSQTQLYNNIQSTPLNFPEAEVPMVLKKIIQSCLQKKANDRINMTSLNQYKNIESISEEEDSQFLKHPKQRQFCDIFCWFS